MSQSQCEERLGATSLGRLGVVIDGRPEIFPIHHAYDRANGCVVFQTNNRTKLHAALSWPWVAFEVDGVDHDDPWAGWSVLVVGRAEEITDHDGIAHAVGLEPVSWSAGDTERWIRIVPKTVSGRLVTRNASTDEAQGD